MRPKIAFVPNSQIPGIGRTLMAIKVPRLPGYQSVKPEFELTSSAIVLAKSWLLHKSGCIPAFVVAGFVEMLFAGA